MTNKRDWLAGEIENEWASKKKGIAIHRRRQLPWCTVAHDYTTRKGPPRSRRWSQRARTPTIGLVLCGVGRTGGTSRVWVARRERHGEAEWRICRHGRSYESVLDSVDIVVAVSCMVTVI